MRHCGLGVTEENWRRFYSRYCQRLGASLERCDGCVLPGVVELLDRLEQMETTVLGLLTGNVAAGADAKLGYYGIRDRFAFGGFGDHRTERNDIAADALAAARDHLAATNGEIRGAMVIGDTAADIACGQSIGAYTVAVATGGAPKEALAQCDANLLLDDLTESDQLWTEITEGCWPS